MPLEQVRTHPDIARLAAYLREHPGRAVPLEPPRRGAAIALVFRAIDGAQPEMLMIKRAEHEGDPWSGHVACPGGRYESEDGDLRTTAIRETREETGIDIARDGEILGTLDDVTPMTAALPPILIRPFVAIVRADVSLTLSEEVAAAFWVSLAALRDRSAWGTAQVTVRGGMREVAAFRHGDHTVWGLTGRVLNQLMSAL